MDGVTVGVLGPLTVTVGGTPIPIAGSKQRTVLAALALHPNHVVSVQELTDLVWGDPAPAGAEHTLQQHVSNLRRLLEPDRGSAPPTVLVTRPPGYLLVTDELDAHEFSVAASRGFAAARDARWADALAAFDRALAWWRGAPLGGAVDSVRLAAVAAGLEEQRLSVVEARIDALIGLGRHQAAIAELEPLVAACPYRERLRAALMLSLYRADRQADALAVYQAGRAILGEELGLEPGPALRNLEQAILEQDPALDLATQAGTEQLHRTYRTGTAPVAGAIELPDGQAVLLVDAEVTIGRVVDAEVRLADSRVSRRHAVIRIEQGRPVLTDLDSTNGTTVQGVPIRRHVLADGDEIGVAGVVLRFRAGETVPADRAHDASDAVSDRSARP